MSLDFINETLNLLDIDHDKITGLPCSISLIERTKLLVFMTDFNYVSFTVVIDNSLVIQWVDSDIFEYFIDDDTQYFIQNYKASLTKNNQQLGFSVCYPVDKIQTFNIVDFVKSSMVELDRFIHDFTSI